jgi:hypothetical protein
VYASAPLDIVFILLFVASCLASKGDKWRDRTPSLMSAPPTCTSDFRFGAETEVAQPRDFQSAVQTGVSMDTAP